MYLLTSTRPPYILHKEEEAVPCDSDASQYFSLTSSVMGYQRTEVHTNSPNRHCLLPPELWAGSDVVPRSAWFPLQLQSDMMSKL